MIWQINKKFRTFLCMPVIALAGCTSLSNPSDAPGKSVAEPPSRQIMLKMKKATSPCDASQIAGLARATNQTLDYVRPMSGNACVIRQRADSEQELASGFRRLVQHPTVEWVEVDGIVKAF